MTGHMYSVVVKASEPDIVEDLNLILDRGEKVFSLILADPEVFKAKMLAQGFEVVAIHKLGETTEEPLPVLV